MTAARIVRQFDRLRGRVEAHAAGVDRDHRGEGERGTMIDSNFEMFKRIAHDSHSTSSEDN